MPIDFDAEGCQIMYPTIPDYHMKVGNFLSYQRSTTEQEHLRLITSLTDGQQGFATISLDNESIGLMHCKVSIRDMFPAEKEIGHSYIQNQLTQRRIAASYLTSIINAIRATRQARRKLAAYRKKLKAFGLL